jgi:hypothetical protein
MKRVSMRVKIGWTQIKGVRYYRVGVSLPKLLVFTFLELLEVPV